MWWVKPRPLFFSLLSFPPFHPFFLREEADPSFIAFIVFPCLFHFSPMLPAEKCAQELEGHVALNLSRDTCFSYSCFSLCPISIRGCLWWTVPFKFMAVNHRPSHHRMKSERERDSHGASREIIVPGAVNTQTVVMRDEMVFCLYYLRVCFLAT